MKWIAIDLDGVVVDFTGGVCAAALDRLGAEVPEPETWDDERFMRHTAFGGSVWEWLRRNPDVWETCPLVPGAKEGLEQLYEMGLQIELLTSKPAWSRSACLALLAREDLVWDRLTLVGRKRIGAADSKADWTEAQVLVDDGPHNLRDFLEAGRTVIAYDQPWNRDFRRENRSPRLRVARNWKEVVRICGTLFETEKEDVLV